MEGGLKVQLVGDYGTQCESDGLDNKEKVDYDNGMTAFFDGTPDDDNDDGERVGQSLMFIILSPLDGLGGCKLADLNYGLTGGSATWTGKGTWTGSSEDPVCIQFFPDPSGTIVNCCCNLDTPSLAQEESSELDNCSCFL